MDTVIFVLVGALVLLSALLAIQSTRVLLGFEELVLARTRSRDILLAQAWYYLTARPGKDTTALTSEIAQVVGAQLLVALKDADHSDADKLFDSIKPLDELARRDEAP